MSNYLKATILDNGNLRLAINEGCRPDAVQFLVDSIREHPDPRNAVSGILEGTDETGVSDAGFLEDASFANIGLTEAPAIATDIVADEDPQLTCVPDGAKLWHYDEYCLEDFRVAILKYGHTDFTLCQTQNTGY